jgi:hydrogenase maturation protease
LKEQDGVSEWTTSTVVAWQQQLKTIVTASSPTRKIALVGMGYSLRSDDYVGSYVVKKLIVREKDRLPEHICLFDGEDHVEALIIRISDLQPGYVIFIDACEMKAEPGETRPISVNQTIYPFFTTHGVPLKLLAEQLLLKSTVWVLCIQPRDTDFGEHPSLVFLRRVLLAGYGFDEFYLTVFVKPFSRISSTVRSVLTGILAKNLWPLLAVLLLLALWMAMYL